MIQIGLLGASGRMGQWVSRLVGTDYNSKVRIAASAGTSSPLEALLNTEVVIDFSSPEAVMKLAHLALDRQAKPPAFVVGST